ncbi:MAG: PAS domain S-box protein [Microcoleaceae cyanobacterium]
MTEISQFENWIEAAVVRLNKIQQNTNNLSPETENILTELCGNIEELHVATEALHSQNEELLTTRYQLETERQRYLELFDFAPDGYLVTDAKAIIQQVNSAAAELFNVPQRYLPGKPLDIFVAQTDREAFNSQWLEITAQFTQACQTAADEVGELSQKQYPTGQLIQDWEVQLQPRGGEPIPVALSLSATCNAEGNLTKLLWLIRDLRPSKQAAAKIRQQAALLDVATDAIWVQDLEGKILYWNQAAEKIYGWTATEALGTLGHQLLVDPASRPNRTAYQTTIEAGRWQGELQKVIKSGEDILVESHWTLVHDSAGMAQSILIVDSDITEKKQLERQLFQAQRLESLGTLVAGIAHDFNNILTPIVPMTQILIHKFPDLDTPTQELLQLIVSSSRRGSTLVQQLLGFTRKVTATRITMQVATEIDHVAQIIKETFPKSIQLYTHLSPDLWSVYGDCSQLHQVLLNMSINARDAMPNGGTLEMTAKNCLIDEPFTRTHLAAKVGQYIAIEISDTGEGIAPENLDLIFEAFFTTKDIDQGTGLGLSTVKRIINNHNGFIEVSSQVGKGTQFQVFLPAVDVPETVMLETEEFRSGNGELILVVDDEESIRQANQIVLETYGYRVLTADNAFRAIELYTQYQSEITVVLMDMMMPLMDGATTIEALLEIDPNIEIVATSGLTNYHQVTENIGNKIKAFLPKPYTSEELLNIL